MHILPQGKVTLANLSKLLLSLISAWCILVILEGVLLKRHHTALRVMICVTGCPDLQDLIEPMVRCLKLEFQLAGIELQIMLDAGGCPRECCTVVRMLINDGVLAPACLGAPDLVLYPGRKLKA